VKEGLTRKISAVKDIWTVIHLLLPYLITLLRPAAGLGQVPNSKVQAIVSFRSYLNPEMTYPWNVFQLSILFGHRHRSLIFVDEAWFFMSRCWHDRAHHSHSTMRYCLFGIVFLSCMSLSRIDKSVVDTTGCIASSTYTGEFVSMCQMQAASATG